MDHVRLGHACTQRAVPVYHEVNPESGVRFDVADVFVQRASFYPDGQLCLGIASGATCGMDHDHVYGLSTRLPITLCLCCMVAHHQITATARHSSAGRLGLIAERWPG